MNGRIRNLMQLLRDRFNDHAYVVYHNHLWRMRNSGNAPRNYNSNFTLFIDWICEEMRFGLLRLVCRVRGHVWESHDWGGPESGGIGAHCTRCGYSWSHTFY